jgi:NAD(P)H-flavin reductase
MCVCCRGGPALEAGYDWQLTELDDGWLVEIGSERGRRLAERFAPLLQPAPAGALAERERRLRATIEHFGEHSMHRVPTMAATRLTSSGRLEPSFWTIVGDRCFECGGCAYLCPTCWCFNVADVRGAGQADFPQLVEGVVPMVPGGTVGAARDGDWQRIRLRDCCNQAGFVRQAGGSSSSAWTGPAAPAADAAWSPAWARKGSTRWPRECAWCSPGRGGPARRRPASWPGPAAAPPPRPDPRGRGPAAPARAVRAAGAAAPGRGARRARRRSGGRNPAVSTAHLPASAALGADPYRPRLVKVLEAREEIAARGTSRRVVTLSLERGDLDYRPGQFFEVGLFGAGEIPISISSPPGLDGALYLSVRAAGLVSTLVTELRPGDLVGLRGPVGNGFPLEEHEGRDVLFVAGGIGLAPLRGLLWEMLLRRPRYGRIVLLHGARTPHDLLYPWQWAAWRRDGVEIMLSADVGEAEWQAQTDPPRVVGFLTTLFPRLHLDPARTVAFLCGPPAMIHIACGQLQRTLALRPERMIVTLERHMKCGIGKCGHCVVVDRYVCVDGPVFRYHELLEMNRIEPPW